MDFCNGFFQGRYCNPECQKEDWEQHRDFCLERREQRKACAREGDGEGDVGGDVGGEGDEERQKAEEEWREEMERCRRVLEAFPMPEVD